MLNKILSTLYDCAMENRSQHCLMQDELRNYQSAIHSEEELETQLEQLLKEEPLRLFKLYVDNKDTEGGLSNISAFRKGFALGLKLGTFCIQQH